VGPSLAVPFFAERRVDDLMPKEFEQCIISRITADEIRRCLHALAEIQLESWIMPLRDKALALSPEKFVAEIIKLTGDAMARIIP